MHRNFMDEKDRIITAIYNDTRARARSVAALFSLSRHHSTRSVFRPPGCSLLQGQQSQASAGAPTQTAASASTPASPMSRDCTPGHQPLSGSRGWPLCGCSLHLFPGLPTLPDAYNKVILRVLVRFPPSGPAPPAWAPPGLRPALRVLVAVTREPGPLGGASPFSCCGRSGCVEGAGPASGLAPHPPRPAARWGARV